LKDIKSFSEFEQKVTDLALNVGISMDWRNDFLNVMQEKGFSEKEIKRLVKEAKVKRISKELSVPVSERETVEDVEAEKKIVSELSEKFKKRKELKQKGKSDVKRFLLNFSKIKKIILRNKSYADSFSKFFEFFEKEIVSANKDLYKDFLSLKKSEFHRYEMFLFLLAVSKLGSTSKERLQNLKELASSRNWKSFEKAVKNFAETNGIYTEYYE